MADDQGRFQISGLAPGEYRVLAMPQDVFDRLEDDSFILLLSAAEKVTLERGGSPECFVEDRRTLGGIMRRRDFLPVLAAPLALAQNAPPVPRKGRIKQGVTRGVFGRQMSLEDCCRDAARLGIRGFDLIGPGDWPLLKKYGLVPSMYPLGPGGTIQDALNQKENHERLEKSLRAAIDESAAAGVPNVITFSGYGAACRMRRARTTAWGS